MENGNTNILIDENIKVNKNNYSREIVTSILGIMILILTLFSVSYAVFVKSFEGEKINSITTSYLTLSDFNNNSGIVNYVDLFPTSDEYGKSCSTGCREFEFMLSNSALKEINYDIIISDINLNVDPKYVKIYLVNAEGVPLYNEVQVLSDLKIDELLNGRVIYSGKISSLGEKLKLRVWVSSDYMENNPVSISFKMNVKGYV